MSGPFANKGPLGGSQLTAAEVLWVQTGEGGILLLEEQGAAPSATANIGKLYVLTADSDLYYLDDSGVSYNLTAGFTELTATGTVNGSNTVFVFIQEPRYIVADGVWLKKTAKNGTVLWTWSAGNATMTNPPGQDIFGIA